MTSRQLRPIRLAAQLIAGAVFGICVFAGATAWLAGSEQPAGQVKLARIEDWPEIKDGVPELVRPKSPASGPLLPSSVAAASVAKQPPSGDAQAAVDPPVEGLSTPVSGPEQHMPSSGQAASDEAVLAQLRSVPAVPSVEIDLVEFEKPSGISPERSTRGPVITSLEAPSGADAGLEDTAENALKQSAPLPPRRPQVLTPKQRPKQAAKKRDTETSVGQEKQVAPPETARTDSSPADQDRVRVLGMTLPSGRAIRDCLLEFRC
jgi:hypothetical protein